MTIKVINYLYLKEIYIMNIKKDTVYVLCLSERHYCNGKLVENTERLNNVIGVYKKVEDANEAALLYCITNNNELEYKEHKYIGNSILEIWYKNKTGNDICNKFEIYRKTIE